MDELKKYLQDNSEGLDLDKPSGDVWKRIMVRTTPKKRPSVFSIALRAAAAACIAGFVFWGAGKLFKARETGGATSPAAMNKERTAADTIIAAIPPAAVMAKQPAVPASKLQKNTLSRNAVKKQLPLQWQLLRSFENNCNKLVALQMKDIRQTPVYTESPDCFNDFKAALKQSETDEKLIRNRIKTTGLSDGLLEQLITVYQVRINLLKSLQHEIARINAKVKENSLPADTLKASFINI